MTSKKTNRGGSRPGAGRPKKVTGKVTQINIKVNQGQLRVLEALIRREASVSSIPDAVRHLIDGAK